MKRFLLPLLAALALPTDVNAEVSDKIHNRCKDASDYMGCVKANSNSQSKIKSVQKKQRPAWMVQKLKGCLKYTEEKKKNYCIKTYSPYGNPIPENLDLNYSFSESGSDSFNTPTGYFNNREVFTHKGESYTASKTCSDGKRFHWNVEKGFLKKEKVVEVGCLSDYELQSLKNQARNKSGGGSGWNGNNQAQQNRMRIQTNEYKRYLDSIKY